MDIRTYDSLPDEGRAIRIAVFMDEQGFTNEFDEIDEISVHCVGYEDSNTVAYCRVFRDTDGAFTFGRLSVLLPYRRGGRGSRMVRYAEREVMRRGGDSMKLHAQCRAEAFYAALGYEAYGDIEDDEGCPHIWMKKSLIPYTEIAIKNAETADFSAVKCFYDTLIDDMAGMVHTPKWTKDVYPDGAYLKGAIERGELFTAVYRGEIIGAFIANHAQSDGYASANWKCDAPAEKITVLHTLAVGVKYARYGIATLMTEYAVSEAKKEGQLAVRLDVIADNLPAVRLYRSLGFAYIGHTELYYEDTGLCGFDLYELGL